MISQKFHTLLLKRTWQTIFFLLLIHGPIVAMFFMGKMEIVSVLGSLFVLGFNLYFFGFERLVQSTSIMMSYPNEASGPNFNTYLEGKALSLGHEHAFFQCYFQGMIHNIKAAGDIDEEDVKAFKGMMMRSENPSLIAPFSYRGSVLSDTLTAHEKMERMRYYHHAKTHADEGLTAKVPWIFDRLCKIFPTRFGQT